MFNVCLQGEKLLTQCEPVMIWNDRVCSTMQAMFLCANRVQIWNSLSGDLKIVKTVAAFKRKLKNSLF